MTNTHSFVKVSELSKPRPSPVPTMTGIAGAEVVCVECGEVRRVWSDGVVDVMHEGHGKCSS